MRHCRHVVYCISSHTNLANAVCKVQDLEVQIVYRLVRLALGHNAEFERRKARELLQSPLAKKPNLWLVMHTAGSGATDSMW